MIVLSFWPVDSRVENVVRKFADLPNLRASLNFSSKIKIGSKIRLGDITIFYWNHHRDEDPDPDTVGSVDFLAAGSGSYL